MSGFSVIPEISVGDILTIVSIGIAVLTLWLSLLKDRQQRKKEYADRIRHAAGVVTAKLERWRELELRFYEDIQPLIIDTSLEFLKKHDVIATRDFLYRGLVENRARSSQKIVDEQIEMAYVDLYGYNPMVQNLYVKVVSQLEMIREGIMSNLLDSTQQDIFQVEHTQEPIQSAQIGSALRGTCHKLAREDRRLMDLVIEPFRKQMIDKLIKEPDDSKIVNRKVQIVAPDKILLKDSELQKQLMSVVFDSPIGVGQVR